MEELRATAVTDWPRHDPDLARLDLARLDLARLDLARLDMEDGKILPARTP